MQKPEEREQEVQRFRDRSQDSESVTHADDTENRKRCIFSYRGFKERGDDFTQNQLRLSLAYVKLIEKN